jgi:hypothetical protein
METAHGRALRSLVGTATALVIGLLLPVRASALAPLPAQRGRPSPTVSRFNPSELQLYDGAEGLLRVGVRRATWTAADPAGIFVRLGAADRGPLLDVEIVPVAGRPVGRLQDLAIEMRVQCLQRPDGTWVLKGNTALPLSFTPDLRAASVDVRPHEVALDASRIAVLVVEIGTRNEPARLAEDTVVRLNEVTPAGTARLVVNQRTATVECTATGAFSARRAFRPQPGNFHSALVANDFVTGQGRCAGFGTPCRSDGDCPKLYDVHGNPYDVPGSCEGTYQIVLDDDFATRVDTALGTRFEGALFRFDQCFSGGFLDDLARELPAAAPWAAFSAGAWHQGTRGGPRSKFIAKPIPGLSLFAYLLIPDSHAPLPKVHTDQLLGNTYLDAFVRTWILDNTAGPRSQAVNHIPQYVSAGRPADVLTLPAPAAESRHAILFAGVPDGCDMFNEMARVYGVLMEAHYPPANVKVLFGSGQPPTLVPRLDAFTLPKPVKKPDGTLQISKKYTLALLRPAPVDPTVVCRPATPAGVPEAQFRNVYLPAFAAAIRSAGRQDLWNAIDDLRPLFERPGERLFFYGDDHGSLYRMVGGQLRPLNPGLCDWGGVIAPTIAPFVTDTGGGCVTFRAGKTVLDDDFVVLPGTCVALQGKTIIEARNVIVAEGGLLTVGEEFRSGQLVATDGDVVNRGRITLAADDDLTLVSRTGDIDIDGEDLMLEAADRLRLEARTGSIQLRGDDSTVVRGGNRVDIVARGAGGSILVSGGSIQAPRINVDARSSSSRVDQKEVRFTDGTVVSTRPGRSHSVGDVNIQATGRVTINEGVVIDSDRNVTVRTRRESDALVLRGGPSLVAREGAGRIQLQGVRGGVSDDGTSAIVGQVRGVIETALPCGGPEALLCPPGYACNLADPECGDTPGGYCEPALETCGRYLDQVCGCDGVTYVNDCERVRLGAVLAARGVCPSEGPAPATTTTTTSLPPTSSTSVTTTSVTTSTAVTPTTAVTTTTAAPPTTTTTSPPPGEDLVEASWRFYVRIARTNGSTTSVDVPKRSGDAPVTAMIERAALSAFSPGDRVTGTEIDALGDTTLARLATAAEEYVQSHAQDYPDFAGLQEVRWAMRVE